MLPNVSVEVKQRIIIPIPEAIHECQRELMVRKRCYANWVRDGKLTAFEAEERFNRLEAAIAWLQRLSTESQERLARSLSDDQTTPANVLDIALQATA